MNESENLLYHPVVRRHRHHTDDGLVVCCHAAAFRIAAVVLGSNLQKRPSRRQVLVEKGVTMLYDMVESTMGKHNSYWIPYIGALFLSSICGSFIGMTGIFPFCSSTADLSTTVTWALMTSFICWGCSIKRNGVGGWLKGFTEPIVVMTPMTLFPRSHSRSRWRSVTSATLQAEAS